MPRIESQQLLAASADFNTQSRNGASSGEDRIVGERLGCPAFSRSWCEMMGAAKEIMLKRVRRPMKGVTELAI
jgi:hypothetical protein